MSLWWPTRHAEGQSPLAPSGAVEGDWLHRGGWLTQGGLTLLGDWFRLVSPLHRHLRRYCQNDITDITMISFFRQSKTHSIRIGEAWKEAIPTYLSPSFNMPKGATSRSKKKTSLKSLRVQSHVQVSKMQLVVAPPTLPPWAGSRRSQSARFCAPS